MLRVRSSSDICQALCPGVLDVEWYIADADEINTCCIRTASMKWTCFVDDEGLVLAG